MSAVDLRRLRAGEIIAGASGILLVVGLLLPWYTHEVATSFGPRPSLPSQNAFEALAVADLLLVILAVAAVGLAITTAAEKTVAVPIAYASLLSLAAVVGLILVLVHLGSSPTPAGGVPAETRVDTGTAGGLYLALLASLGILAGALLAMRDERLSRDGRPTDQTGRPLEQAPEIEHLATPR